MIRQHFHQELSAIQDDVLRLGSMVEKMVMRAVAALRERDVRLAEQVVEDDNGVDRLAYAVEDRVLLLICTQQPVATDLRRLAAALVIVHELERMGDHAEGIAKIGRRLAREPALLMPAEFDALADQANQMLSLALKAYIDRDTALAERVWAMDDRADELYNSIYRHLFGVMMETPATIERATRLLHAAHDLERVGDRVTNICERIMYISTGQPYYVRPSGAARAS
jgi:phosphate transport system protein